MTEAPTMVPSPAGQAKTPIAEKQITKRDEARDLWNASSITMRQAKLLEFGITRPTEAYRKFDYLERSTQRLVMKRIGGAK